MDDVWDTYADHWDEEPGTRAYSRAAFASLQPVLDGVGIELLGARVLDFGCGTGLLTEHLVDAGSGVTAIDTSQAMLAVLRAKVDRHHWAGVAVATDLDDVPGGNDVIVCSSVCSFLDDYPATAARLVALLRPGGVFVQWDWERGEDGHGLDRTEIVEALGGAGLEQITVETAFEVDVEGHTMRPLIGHGRRPGGASGPARV